jgi:hypothetical protein
VNITIWTAGAEKNEQAEEPWRCGKSCQTLQKKSGEFVPNFSIISHLQAFCQRNGMATLCIMCCAGKELIRRLKFDYF